MDKIEPQSPNKIPNTPLRPILNNWSINRKLEKLEQDYRSDQEKRPAEIKSSSIVNPAGAAISYRVERLKQYVEEREGIYDADIKAGRLADTADLWVEVYKRILVFVKAQTNSLLGNVGHELARTGGGRPGEQEAVQEVGRELSRLVAGLESRLATACNHAEQANVSAPAITQIRRRKLDVKVGNGMAYLAASLLRAIELSDLESRLRALEERNGGGNGD
jgi:hypothetical protein